MSEVTFQHTADQTTTAPRTAIVLFALLLGATGGSSCDCSSADPDDRPRRSTHRTADGSGATGPASIPDDQTRTGFSNNRLYRLEVAPEPNPIPFQELFELRIEIYGGGNPEKIAEEARIDDLRAVMPAHDHGMKTAPRIERVAPGTFRAHGMRFHMQGADEDGRWVLELVIRGSRGVDRAEFDLQCCRPR